MNSNKQCVKLQADYKSSVSQTEFPRTLLGVPWKIMELISINFEMPQKISTIAQNITGIAVKQLEILTNGNN
jgi:DNA helicase IV